MGSARRLGRADALRVASLVLAAMVVVGAVIVVLGLALPREWHVERAVLISATPAEIHTVVSDLERWDEWAQGQDGRGDTVVTLGPVTRGQGARLRWQSPSASGEVTIVESDPARGVVFELRRNTEPSSRAAVRYEPKLATTEVTWTDRGTLEPIWGALMRDFVQTELEAHLQTGLARLKAIVEARAPAAPPP